MSTLKELIEVAEKLKPEFGESCNNCGWCCLTEVCATGVQFGKSTKIPCQFLEQEGDKHFCGLAKRNIPVMSEHLGIGTGCDARTQLEVIKSYGVSL